MARLRYNGLATTLGGSGLAPADTAVTFSGALTHSGGIAVPTISGGDYIPLTLLDSSGNVAEIVNLTAYTSGTLSGTITRAQESTTAKTHAAGVAVVNAPTVSDFSGQSGVLAVVNYNPATQVQKTTAATSWTDVDATNLAVTFTAPASGRVIVTLAGLTSCSSTNSNHSWALRAGTTLVTGSQGQVLNATSALFLLNVPRVISGLTPGASYTWKWCWRVDNTAITANLWIGGTTDNAAGPASMTVVAA